jgi:hypothetical protein
MSGGNIIYIVYSWTLLVMSNYAALSKRVELYSLLSEKFLWHRGPNNEDN